MKWLAPVLLWAAAACGESVIVASELVSDAGASGDECGGERTPAELAPAVFELIVDSSGSMGESLGEGRGSNWSLTRDALLDTIDALPEQVSVGLVFFPDIVNSPSCFDFDADVDIGALGPSGSEQRQRIVSSFQEQATEGAAPTHDAYAFAFNQLGMSRAPGRRFILLITDDYPTHELECDDDGPVESSPLVMATSFALMNRVRTFVVGLPGTEAQLTSSTLSRMAFAGGTAQGDCAPNGEPRYCHHDLTDKQALPQAMERTLAAIMAEALSCAYSAPAAGGADAAEQLEVFFNPEDGPTEALQRNPFGPCSDGWQSSPDGSTIVLCEDTCNQVREGKGRIELRSACETP